MNEKVPELKAFYDLLSVNTAINKLYEQIIENLQLYQYKDAIFFADKLLTLVDQH